MRIPKLMLSLVAVPLCLPATAQSPQHRYYEAYYLEHEKGDLKGALELYRDVAAAASAPDALRQRAERQARSVGEELASADLARLMPPDTIAYLELGSPGAQLERLLSQLGLVADGGRTTFGIRPELVRGALGLRGAAVAITDIDPRRGPTNGVLVLHPGRLELVRGLIETALPVAAQQVEPIGGCRTFDVEGKALVTLTERLVIASATRDRIEGVLARLRGEAGPSLATAPSSAAAMKMRGDHLLFFCLNVEPMLPMLEQAMQRAARHDPGAQAAMAFLDVRSTRSLAGRIGVDDNGVSLELGLDLDKGHRNLAFNLLRLPPLDREALGMIPAGTAFFVAGALNRRGDIPPGAVDGRGRPAVTMMDFGRELFANLAQFAIYALPEVHRGPHGPMPELALSMRVNDPARSQALWSLILGSVQAATGGAAEPQQDGDVQRYEIHGVPVFLGRRDHMLALSPIEGAVTAALSPGRSVLDDDGYGSVLAHLGEGSTLAAAAQVGRCLELGMNFMSQHERREAQQFAPLLHDTAVALRLQHTEHRLGATARLTGIPDIGPMVTDMIEQRRGRAHRHGRRITVVRQTPGTAERVPDAGDR